MKTRRETTHLRLTVWIPSLLSGFLPCSALAWETVPGSELGARRVFVEGGVDFGIVGAVGYAETSRLLSLEPVTWGARVVLPIPALETPQGQIELLLRTPLVSTGEWAVESRTALSVLGSQNEGFWSLGLGLGQTALTGWYGVTGHVSLYVGLETMVVSVVSPTSRAGGARGPTSAFVAPLATHRWLVGVESAFALFGSLELGSRLGWTGDLSGGGLFFPLAAELSLGWRI